MLTSLPGNNMVIFDKEELIEVDVGLFVHLDALCERKRTVSVVRNCILVLDSEVCRFS